MAPGIFSSKRFNLEKIIWGIVLIGCLIMFKYSISDKDAIVTGGKYPIPLWPFKPNMDQYRELVGSTCYKLSPTSLEKLASAGLPDEIRGAIEPLANDSCNQESAFLNLLDKHLAAAHQINADTLERLATEGLPEPLLTLLGNLKAKKPMSPTRFLRQIEKQTSFKLTGQALAKLKSKGVPPEVVEA